MPPFRRFRSVGENIGRLLTFNGCIVFVKRGSFIHTSDLGFYRTIWEGNTNISPGEIVIVLGWDVCEQNQLITVMMPDGQLVERVTGVFTIEQLEKLRWCTEIK